MATMLVNVLPGLDEESQRIIQIAALKEIRKSKELRRRYLKAVKDFDASMEMMASAYQVRCDMNATSRTEVELLMAKASQGQDEQQWTEWM